MTKKKETKTSLERRAEKLGISLPLDDRKILYLSLVESGKPGAGGCLYSALPNNFLRRTNYQDEF